MAVVTALLRKHTGGAVAGAGVGDGFARCFVNSKEVSAVGHEDREAKGLSAGFQIVTAHRVIDRGVLGVIVVFDHENSRRLQHNRHIHGFKAGALIHRAVAGERHCDLAVFTNFCG